MQLKEAQKLRETWGDAPCTRPHLVQEYHLGSSTGEYVCMTCGRSSETRDGHPSAPTDVPPSA